MDIENDRLGEWQRNQAIGVKLNRSRIASLFVSILVFLAGFPAYLFWFANGNINLKPAAFWLTIATSILLAILLVLKRKYKSLQFELTSPVWYRVTNWTAITFFPLGQHENDWGKSDDDAIIGRNATCRQCKLLIGVNDLSAFCSICKNQFHFRCMDFNKDGCSYCIQVQQLDQQASISCLSVKNNEPLSNLVLDSRLIDEGDANFNEVFELAQDSEPHQSRAQILLSCFWPIAISSYLLLQLPDLPTWCYWFIIVPAVVMFIPKGREWCVLLIYCGAMLAIGQFFAKLLNIVVAVTAVITAMLLVWQAFSWLFHMIFFRHRE